ncbi:uncharacterized protein LOC134665132 [Cydia fagiglandana]|uniref:uncharacterized protein LOC134665132 n=1 Tax=Cydia fagiglandana TaxID=1458189 RepID=UPI002FEE2561
MNCTLEESTTERISPLLEKIISRIQSQNNAQESTQKDYMFILIVVLMIENGFLPLKSDLELLHNVESLDAEQLRKWKNNSSIYEAVFSMPGMESFPLKVIMSPLGAMVLLNVLINKLDFETYSVCLPVSRYVVSPQASKIPMIFRDLKHLSTVFKNKILSVVKSIILTQLGYSSASLIGVPEEVFIKIMLYLPVNEIVQLSMLCKRLNYLIDNETLWHELCKRDFGNQLTIRSDDWKEVYRELYIAEHNRKLPESHRLAGSMHDHMDYSDFVSYIDNPMWDVII